MSFFDNSVPPLRRKRINLPIDKSSQCFYFQWRIGNYQLYSNLYTQIDLALIVWALLIFPMFITAQFLSINWITQTILWSLISFTGLLAMVALSNYWLYKKGLIWLLYCWIILMLCGLICTNYAIFFGWGELLVQICNLWLGLSAIGYLFTGIGVHSRALIFIGLLHILATLLLPYFSSWQFLFTGIVMSFSLLLLAEFQWDMQN
ncbi:hypothetical protein Nos7524_5426 [Nostoc sp. PCC 7524]|uniref:hypothetical protein n=1 Tax=Nostoc sp. (strain ATCC 29411 / PCC 7524) TaxID=28072 RepID=UPI00029F2CF6|nr:hypothetical protein [Nostoc sp. PCC 7524]AFY51143.1 hypothetical protein Nos7524_5426 [Nostoc sp. PCC 7524]